MLPGGGTIVAGFDAIQLLSKQIAKQMDRRTELRYTEFISNLFEGEITPEASEFLTADDFYALLSGCMADMENEKAKYYGKLASAIGKGEITGSSRRYIILILTQLSEAQLQMLRKSFISSQYKIQPAAGAGNLNEIDILALSDDVQHFEFKDLQAKSLYSEGQLTSFAVDLVRACYDSRELTPCAIGHIAWAPESLDILFDSGETKILLALIDRCWRSAMHSSNNNVLSLKREFFTSSSLPKVLIMCNEDPSSYLPNLVNHIDSPDLIIVSCHDNEQLIRQYYPDVIIISAIKKSANETAELVMKKVTFLMSKRK